MSRLLPTSFATLLLAAAVIGCGGGGSALPPQEPGSRATTAGGMTGSHVTVGLRVTLDEGEGEDAHVHVIAVTTDVDGHESTTDVGDFPGRVDTGETDAAHVTIDDQLHHRREVIWTQRHGNIIEIRRRAIGAPADEYEVVDRIEIEEGPE